MSRAEFCKERFRKLCPILDVSFDDAARDSTVPAVIAEATQKGKKAW